MATQLAMVLLLYAVSFLLFKPYRSIVRQTGMAELHCIGNSVALALIVSLSMTLVFEIVVYGNELSAQQVVLPIAQLFVHAMMVGVGLTSARLVYKNVYRFFFWHKKSTAIPVILFGAGDMGHNTFQLLQFGSRNKFKIVGVVDDNPSRIGKAMHGFRINSLSDLDAVFLERIGGAQQLVIAIDDHQPARLQRVAAQAENLSIKMKIIPKSAKLMEDIVATKQIRTLKIDDLLGRKSIEINNPAILAEMTDKVVLVTGGAGSIGSELVRQISRTDCSKLIVLDQAESALYEIQQELKAKIDLSKAYFIVGNVRDYAFMDAVFSEHRPHIVFHAAAYKHVPLMEDNPYEAVLTNVCGSSYVAKLSDKYQVQKFVMVSTDKAVNPTNVMGATKRAAEIFVASLNQLSNTAYIVTRFGNVLGSNGSVIPLFEKQIKLGGPITITHPDITRYFMTIPEACKLVQEAGIMGSGGEVFVFDMGSPVRILDLAIKMIKLKGLRYPDDIDIKYIGLRPGEKKYEELLATDENTIKTYHEKILIAKVSNGTPKDMIERIESLCAVAQQANAVQEKMNIVAILKSIVPEYISNNSLFTELDNINVAG
ncbi:polysaccharide biosynthesis protein [Sphingobacterium corticis]|uniref:Polysaccharide biosynthesis protein n=2 Tax=Sphingobacterium corticis TaxID=1812823 RepID=A0ABW5NG02_9SPHI